MITYDAADLGLDGNFEAIAARALQDMSPIRYAQF